MNTLFINKLCVMTSVGIHKWEKSILQKILLDIKIKLDIKKNFYLDDIRYSIDYTKVHKEVINLIQKKHFNLIETIAIELSDMIIDKFLVSYVKIKITKPSAIPEALNVGIIIEKYLKSK
ncbi:ygiG [Wigglesworthia glossinidia endosymbiont of Glossina brevipalpis]|uniref:7,8-dihydroneopterin aldolase n=1 Tax=Wigglesworthia glossinidia brevipalpis TaxID=36870 RepID=Q8D282_WIGBR|nr:ygiG [Wigglesworthia glossinidia endosymbiont of Glossina brevipalpis]